MTTGERRCKGCGSLKVDIVWEEKPLCFRCYDYQMYKLEVKNEQSKEKQEKAKAEAGRRYKIVSR